MAIESREIRTGPGAGGGGSTGATPDDGVRRVAVPPAVRSLSALAAIDYADAFLLHTAYARERTAEQWARASLESGPAGGERVLRTLLSTIALELGPARADGFVAGWEIRSSTPTRIRLGANAGRAGISGELIFERKPRAVLWTTLVRLDGRAARAVWTVLAPVHRQVVRYLLEQERKRIG